MNSQEVIIALDGMGGDEAPDSIIEGAYIASKKLLNIKKKRLKNTNILIVGLTYKYGVSDMRNSLNFNIFQKVKELYKKTDGYDPFVNENIKKKF